MPLAVDKGGLDAMRLYVRNPAYADVYDELTNWPAKYARLRTGQPTTNVLAVAANSFLQMSDGGDTSEIGPFGFHINSANRMRGDLASMSLYHALTTDYAPWSGKRDSDLFIYTVLNRPRVRRTSAEGHAYGVPMLRFRDVSSGRYLLVTLQAFSTIAPGDFVGGDTATGDVIVSTVFRGDPLFGKRLSGDFIDCAAGCPTDGPPYQEFRFRINRDDFTKVLTLARTLDARLSADPSDYLLSRFECRAETYLDAELGATFGSCYVQVTF
jgi:hypothetical protein